MTSSTPVLLTDEERAFVDRCRVAGHEHVRRLARIIDDLARETAGGVEILQSTHSAENYRKFRAENPHVHPLNAKPYATDEENPMTPALPPEGLTEAELAQYRQLLGVDRHDSYRDPLRPITISYDRLFATIDERDVALAVVVGAIIDEQPIEEGTRRSHCKCCGANWLNNWKTPVHKKGCVFGNLPAATKAHLEMVEGLRVEIDGLKSSLAASEESRKFWFDAADVENKRATSAESERAALAERALAAEECANNRGKAIVANLKRIADLEIQVSTLTQSQRRAGTVEVCSECDDRAHDGKFNASGMFRNKPCPVATCPLRPQHTQEG